MDFILPTIGYHMNDRGIFQLTKADLLKEVERSFSDAILPVQIMEIPVFPEYESERESLGDLKEQLCRIPSNRYLDIIVNILGVMNRNGVSGYSFVHHHIRDYFAAYYIIQRMREALAVYNYGKNTRTQGFTLDDSDDITDNIRHCLEPVFYEIPDETIKSFIREILGEHRNIPVLDTENHWHIPNATVPEQTMLRQLLDLYRYSPVDPQYLISNIVEIIKKVRKTVAGENFDGLDLRQCRFYEKHYAAIEDQNRRKAVKTAEGEEIMERERQLQEIHRQLADICTKAKLENAINIYSVNLIFENLIRDILNCIYECRFENANYICHNQQGYDLIEADLKTVVQISSENRAGKIQRSLNHLGFDGRDKWRFCFFLLGESAEKLRKKDYQTPLPVTFYPKEDIWDMTWLIKKINNLDSGKIYSVYLLLCNQPGRETITKRDIWNSVYKDYQMCMEEHFYISEEEIGWQKDRSGSVYFNIQASVAQRICFP